MMNRNEQDPSLPVLLVMCTGNVCRSPMAETVLRHQLAQRGIPATVASCGLGAPIGRAPHPFALQVNQERDVPIAEDKRALQCSSADLKRAAVVFVMDNGHRHEIMRRYAFASGKTFLLGHWQGQEIADPLHDPVEVFRQVYDQVEQGCDAWIDHLLQGGMLHARAD